MAKSPIPRFEIDHTERLAQARAATNAVRMPRLGYQMYRVYDIVDKKYKESVNSMYGVTHYNSHLYAILDELFDPTYKLQWLKPKRVTFLQLKGHRVELAKPGDKTTQRGPVRLGA